MTTIAYKDGIICADRQATAGRASKLCQKLWLVDDIHAVAITGSLSAGIRFCEWFKNGADKKDNWTLDEYSEAILLNINTGEVCSYDENMVAMPLFCKFDAWGSGSDFAIGAMEAGMDAVKAVEIAAKHDTWTGNGLAVINLNIDKKVRNYAHWRNWKGRKR